MAGGSGKLVGIDLGTTFSAVATLDDRGQPITLPNRDGEMLTPSAVLLFDDGTAVVGQSALDVALEQPDRVATLIKLYPLLIVIALVRRRDWSLLGALALTLAAGYAPFRNEGLAATGYLGNYLSQVHSNAGGLLLVIR